MEEIDFKGRSIARVARIVRLRTELTRKKDELEGLVAQYIELNRDPKKPVPWRKLARGIRMDHVQLYRIAKSKG